jgi:hypothetical protein
MHLSSNTSRAASPVLSAAFFGADHSFLICVKERRPRRCKNGRVKIGQAP